MVQLNKTRTDLLEKFKRLIEGYNKGLDVDSIFAKLVIFAKELGEEDRRGVSEQLTEEELALFDILVKPELEMTAKDRKEVKLVARKLLQNLKQAKLVLDWRKKLRTRADVYSTVKTILDDLPRIFTPELYQNTCGRLGSGSTGKNRADARNGQRQRGRRANEDACRPCPTPRQRYSTATSNNEGSPREEPQ